MQLSKIPKKLAEKIYRKNNNTENYIDLKRKQIQLKQEIAVSKKTILGTILF